MDPTRRDIQRLTRLPYTQAKTTRALEGGNVTSDNRDIALSEGLN